MSICLALTNIDWSITKDAFSIVGTFISAFGVFVALYIGLMGLATWRRQIKGTGDHELARKVLIELYKYREAIERVRSPAMWAYEVGLEIAEVNEKKPSIKWFQGMSESYSRQLSLVDSVRGPLNVVLMEAEALWGGDLKGLFSVLFTLQHELVVYINFYLFLLNPTEDEAKCRAFKAALNKRRDIRYGIESEGADVYQQEFDLGLVKIEQFLKEKLIR